MPLRTSALTALCAAGLLTLPAAASAAGTVVGGPVKVKDYTMTLTASDAAKDSLGVIFSRTAGKSSQTHMYSFDTGVTVKAKGAGASIKGNLGRFGSVNLKLRGAGAAKRGRLPAGCKGSAGTARKGTLKGSFKLVADSTYFRTVTSKSLKAQVLKGGKLDCAPGDDGNASALGLSATITGPEGMLMFGATKADDGGITQSVTRMDDDAATAPASIMHFISAPGGAAAFAPAADLMSATGTAVSPFLKGSFSYAGETSMGSGSMGKLTGDFTAAFDSIGSQQIASGSPDAMLMRR